VASGITGAAYTMAALKNPPQTMQTTQSSATQKLPAALRNGAANTRYGISLSESFSHLQADQMAAQLQQIKQLGFTDIRFTVSWYGVQPTNATTYNWKQYDTLVSAVSASGLHGLAIINYTPAWARAAACPATAYCMPANLHEYATFAAATARRYAPQGLHHYELWNEENIKSFWQPAPSASSYASLLKAAYPAIKAADADSVVVTGGMSGVSVASPGYSEPRDYLTALYQDGAGNDFDAVGYHAYTFPDSPNDSDGGKNAWSKIANAQPSLRSIMAAHGDAAKPIWVTEVGAPTDGPGSTVGDGMRRSANSDHVTPSMQASIAEQVLQDSKQTPGLGALFWYTYQDLGTSQSNNENFFGLQSKSRAPKPALSIFSRFLQNRSN
jgi:exo-beta-1,3-glucanase (GH17 family)